MDSILAATQRDFFWVPESVRVIERPEVTALADGGAHALMNQVVRVGADADLPKLFDEVVQWHPTVSQVLVVPDNRPDALEDVLPRFGYAPSFHARAYTFPTDGTVAEGEAEVVRVHDLATLRDNLEACSSAFGRPRTVSDLERELTFCTGPEARTARFVAYVDGRCVGSANINRFSDLAFGFLWAGGVVEDARGRGVYRALLAARLRWAAEQGLSHVGLYARLDTSAPVVERVGFTAHGPMAYWTRKG